MKPRWWKRLWLRYLFYWKQHWIIAASVTLTVLWFAVQVAWQFLPVVLEFAFEAVVSAL